MFTTGFQTFRPINVLLIHNDDTDASWAHEALNGTDEPPIQLVQVDLLSSALLRLQDADDIHLILLIPELRDAQSPAESIERIHSLRPDLPVVVLSASETTGLETMESGATCYLPMSRDSQLSLSRILFKIIERYRSQEDLRRIVASNTDGILIVNSRRKVLFTNQAAVELLNLNFNHLEDYVFDYPIAPNLVEIELPDHGTAEMRVDEIPWDGQVAMLITLREVTDRWHMDRFRERYKRGDLSGATL